MKVKVAKLVRAIADAERFIEESKRVLATNGNAQRIQWPTAKTTGIIKAQSKVLSQSLISLRKSDYED